ncbi:unnamed protein product, partial [Prorocentrum cordatum]
MTFGSRLDSHRSATNNNARCHCSPLPHALMAAEYTMVLARKGTTSLNTSSASLHCVACPSSLMLSTMAGHRPGTPPLRPLRPPLPRKPPICWPPDPHNEPAFRVRRAPERRPSAGQTIGRGGAASDARTSLGWDG